MNKLFTRIKNKADSAIISIKNTLAEKRAEGYVDSAVKIIIAVVIGGALLAGLYLLFNSTILPTLTTKITNLFNYSGT